MGETVQIRPRNAALNPNISQQAQPTSTANTRGNNPDTQRREYRKLTQRLNTSPNGQLSDAVSVKAVDPLSDR